MPSTPRDWLPGSQTPLRALAALSLLLAVCAHCGSETVAETATPGAGGQTTSTSDGGGATGAGAPVEVPRPKVALAFDEGSGQQVSAGGVASAFRSTWELLGVPSDPDSGAAAIQQTLDQLEAAGINALFRYVSRADIDALRDPSSAPAWDTLGALVDAARARGFEVHLVFEPLHCKYISDPGAAGDCSTHYDWLLQDADSAYHLSRSPVDLANDAARQWEVDSLKLVAERYHPDVLQFEEFYYHTVHRADQGYNSPHRCLIPGRVAGYSTGMVDRFKAQQGHDPSACDAASNDWNACGALCAVKREALEQFGREARDALLAVDPAIALHVNVATRYVRNIPLGYQAGGFQPDRWMDGQVAGGTLMDGYVPQLYYDQNASSDDFATNLNSTHGHYVGRGSLLAGVELYFWNSDGTTVGFNTHAMTQTLLAEQGNASQGVSAIGGSGLWATYVTAGGQDILAHFASQLGDAKPVPLSGVLGATAEAEPSDPAWAHDAPGDKCALLFDGVDDYVKVPSAYALDEYGAFTFAARLRLAPGRNGSETFMTRGQQGTMGYLWLHLSSDAGRIVLGFADGSALGTEVESDPTPMADGSWHHLAVVQDRKERTFRFYLDGTPFGTSSYAVALPVATGELLLGEHPALTTDYAFHGEMNDVRWFRRTLSSEQVAALASGP
jgi:hypothetical protein